MWGSSSSRARMSCSSFRSVPRRLSVECQQIPIAGPDTNSKGDRLLEQLPHGLAGGFIRRPQPHGRRQFSLVAVVSGPDTSMLELF
jgi:hypothetical protein